MKMTLREARERYMSLESLADLRLPARLSYAISKNLGKLKTEHEQTEKERIKICERYCRRDEHGNAKMKDAVIQGRIQQSYDIDAEGENAVNGELEALLDEEAEIDIRMVPSDALQYEGGQYDALTARNMAALEFMTEE